MLQLSLLLTDSEVASVLESDTDLVVRLSAAAVVQASDAANEKPMLGISNGVWLRLGGARVIQREGALVGRLAGGAVDAAGRSFKALVLPSVFEGDLRLTLELANQSLLQVSATRLEAGFERPANFAESLACWPNRAYTGPRLGEG